MEITLEYWNNLANQLVLISSLLGGFSIAIVANLIVSDKNDKLTNALLKTATVSAGCFLVTLFAMTKISIMTSAGGFLKNVTDADFLVPRLLGTLTFFFGLLALTTLLSLSGWTKSKKVGLFTTSVGILTLILILFTLIEVSY